MACRGPHVAYVWIWNPRAPRRLSTAENVASIQNRNYSETVSEQGAARRPAETGRHDLRPRGHCRGTDIATEHHELSLPHLVSSVPAREPGPRLSLPAPRTYALDSNALDVLTCRSGRRQRQPPRNSIRVLRSADCADSTARVTAPATLTSGVRPAGP